MSPVLIGGLGVAALGALILILGLMQVRQAVSPGGSVFEAKPVMNRGEREMYIRLLREVPAGFMVLAQVQVASFVQVRGMAGNDRWQHLNGIIRLSVDFLVVETKSMAPVVAIELDGPSHFGAGAVASGQRDADERKNSALAGAGVALMRVRVQDVCDFAQLRSFLARRSEFPN